MGNEFIVKVQTRHLNDQAAIVELQGELDLYTISRAKEVIASLLETGYFHLAINLHQTSYLDSTGLGLLLGTLRRVREHGGDLRLVAPSSHVRRLLEIARLTSAFQIDATEQEAEVHLVEEQQPAA